MATAAAAAGTSKPGDDKPAADKPAADRPAADKPAADKPAADKPAADQPAGDKPAADKPADATAEPARKDGEPPAQPKAPEKYALELPDDSRLDAADLAEIEKAAREHDLTNDEAQALVAERAELLEGIATRFLAETTADPVYGGANLAETQRLANLALDRIQPKGTPAGDRTRAVLQKTGYGNHIVFVSLMADVGKLLAEDTAVVGRGGGGGTETPVEKRFYDHPTSRALEGT